MPKRIKPQDPAYIPSFSFLKGAFGPGRTPAKELYKREQPRETTPAQMMGNAVEDWLCLPDGEFWGKYIYVDLDQRPKPDKDFRTKVNKDWLNEQMAFAAEKGLTPLMSDIHQAAFGIKERLKQDGCPFLSEQWQYQVETHGDIDGMKYRGFMDAYSLFTVCDLKTCTDAGAGFKKQMRQNFINVQLALYMNASGAGEGQVLALEVKPPYDWQIWTMYYDSEEHRKAISIARGWLQDFQRWSDMGKPSIGPQFWGPTRPIELYN